MQNSPKRLFGAIAIALGLFAPASLIADESSLWADEINYIKSHGVSVITNGQGRGVIVLETAFKTDRAPNMRIHLGNNGVPNHAADLGPVAKIQGLQVFEAPTSIDILDFNELYIWNVDANAALGMAPLK